MLDVAKVGAEYCFCGDWIWLLLLRYAGNEKTRFDGVIGNRMNMWRSLRVYAEYGYGDVPFYTPHNFS